LIGYKAFVKVIIFLLQYTLAYIKTHTFDFRVRNDSSASARRHTSRFGRAQHYARRQRHSESVIEIYHIFQTCYDYFTLILIYYYYCCCCCCCCWFSFQNRFWNVAICRRRRRLSTRHQIKCWSSKVIIINILYNIYVNNLNIYIYLSILNHRWMSPESLLDKVWSEKTDVWAYGVLM
jgi:hypothetical protein